MSDAAEQLRADGYIVVEPGDARFLVRLVSDLRKDLIARARIPGKGGRQYTSAQRKRFRATRRTMMAKIVDRERAVMAFILEMLPSEPMRCEHGKDLMERCQLCDAKLHEEPLTGEQT